MNLPQISDPQYLGSHTLWCGSLHVRSFVRAPIENQCNPCHSLVRTWQSCVLALGGALGVAWKLPLQLLTCPGGCSGSAP